MKILCPIDFSHASIQAAKWATNLLESAEGGSIDFVYFINLHQRAEMFLSIDEILRVKAEEDFELLDEQLKLITDCVKFNFQIKRTNPKEGIVKMTRKESYDLVLLGSQGLTALKDMIIGSVTRYIFNHTATPVLAVPPISNYNGIQTIAVAVDDTIIDNLDSLELIKILCRLSKAHLKILHVHEDKESPLEYDPVIDMHFKDIGFEYIRLPLEGTINRSLHKYCKDNQVDMLVLLHKRTNWFANIFVQSYSQKELYNLELPLLILRQD